MKAIEEQAPELFQKIIKLGKSKPLYEIYETVLIVILVIVGTFFSARLINSEDK